ncbi:MAG TPA: DUF4010 domain-containing protein [Candidatus Binatia bacterium]|jgi:uncharacterized membrane protein (DUF4010 family)|nr:DUF4010 domain-containing protein [Candidatus Binatia bacterium]
MLPALDAPLRLLAAVIGGAAVGVEREWSGHASGPGARLGGIRTFALLGGLGGIAGLLADAGQAPLAAVLMAGAGALIVAAYVAASRHDVDGTTEVAAFVVLAAGVAAGIDALQIASGMVAVTCLLLVEKSRLHALVARLDDVELRAGTHFAVMAVVVLPLLPEGPFGPYGGIRPRALWILVLLFAGLSFAGYVARRIIGPGRGYVMAGLLGGLVSSTSVTLTFARASVGESAMATSLARGVVAACTVMFVRMLAATAILSPPLAPALLPVLLVPALVGTAMAWRGDTVTATTTTPTCPENPLQLRNALQMAALFQVVLMVVELVRTRWGDAGLVTSGALLGLTDVDALTVAMASSVAAGTPTVAAARAIAVGAAANTVVKLGLVLLLGGSGFRARAAVPLLVLVVATIVVAVLVLGLP